MGTFVCPVCSLPGSLYDEEYIRPPDTRRYIHPKCWRCHECQQPLHQWRETTTDHFVCQIVLKNHHDKEPRIFLITLQNVRTISLYKK